MRLWKTSISFPCVLSGKPKKKELSKAPVVAYPQEKGYTRITEYTKLPVRDAGEKTTYAIEYPLPYESEKRGTVLSGSYRKSKQEMYEQYKKSGRAV